MSHVRNSRCSSNTSRLLHVNRAEGSGTGTANRRSRAGRWPLASFAWSCVRDARGFPARRAAVLERSPPDGASLVVVL